MTAQDELVAARIDGFTHGGEGVARVEGKAVFVPGALPGERVRLRVVEDRRRWSRAELVAVDEPADGRVEPPCPVADTCGGCDLQHAAPDLQRELKTRVVREQLERIGRVAAAPVAPCRAVGPDLGYRTHAQLHAAPDGRLGYLRARSHEVVPVATCPILSPATQAVRTAVGDATGATRVAVRASDRTGAAAAALTPGPGPLDLPGGELDLVLVQPDGTGLPIRGDGMLTERIDDLELAYDTSSFFQVSPEGAEQLVAEVLRQAGAIAGALVWDLYAGVGLLSLPLARAGAEVVAVEGHGPATDRCRDNALAAGVDVTVVATPVERFVGDVAAGRVGDVAAGPVADVADGRGGHEHPEVVVLDPPRVGAGTAVLDPLVRLAPVAIVYVACDVAALARDTRTLTEAGYRLTTVQPLDLFPMTHHVETVATFVR